MGGIRPALAPPDKVQNIGLDHPEHIGNALVNRISKQVAHGLVIVKIFQKPLGLTAALAQGTKQGDCPLPADLKRPYFSMLPFPVAGAKADQKKTDRSA